MLDTGVKMKTPIILLFCLGACEVSIFGQMDVSKIRTCTELFAGGKAQGVDQPACLWKKKTLTVRFLRGDPFVERKIEYYAKQWTPYSGIAFLFTNSGDTDIRIDFNPESGSWSYVGACQSDIPQSSPTMNFGWLTRNTDDMEYRRVVLHEFGHALGLLHEHQNPAAGIPWNEEAVYEYYKQTQHWDRQKIKANVLDKYSEAESNHGKYDPNSIMEYPIPPELTTNGFQVGWNTELSPEDKRFISQVYGVIPTTEESVLPAAVASQNQVAATDKSAGGETGLEAGWPTISSAPQMELMTNLGAMAEPERPLPPPATVSAPQATVSAPQASAPFSEERMGKLENYIRHNASVRKTEQLRSDPRLNVLPMSQRGDFLNEYGTLMFSKVVLSRDSLIERTHQLDVAQMEMEDRSMQLREDIATYNTDNAILNARIEEHNKTALAYGLDLTNWENEVAGYNTAYADFSSRLQTHNTAVADHNTQVAQYSQQCLNGPLDPGPYAQCVSWQQRLNARAQELNAAKEGLDTERAKFAQEQSDLDARKAALQQRANEINERKAQFDAEIQALKKRHDDLAAEQQKLEDWQTSSHNQWQFELGQIDQWRALLDKFNARLETALNEIKTP
jgi:astacin (peptidase family M12A)